jgi:S-adenosylmethionine:tRNA ribosyltransferase-isomerase
MVVCGQQAMSELDRYDYRLPPERIAQRPLARRADAKLMVVDRARQSLEHWHIRDLPEILHTGDCLVLNDTRVVPARLLGRRASTGGHWEGLFLSVEADGRWRLLCKVRGTLSAGERVALDGPRGEDPTHLRLLEKLPGGVWLARPEPDENPWTLLDRVGHTPLPHYILRGRELESDRDRYQTVFARHPGAVAAPTAGLHFTHELLKQLADAGIQECRVTLHVGLDTFRPIKSATLAEHQMHKEWCQLLPEAAERLRACRAGGGRLVAVGTTSVRVLETAAADGGIKPWTGPAELFIRPPYEFRAVDALLTNFHLPRTTLLVLVRTFGGDELVMRAYEEAIRAQYRFYSYGDAMLIV